MPGRKLSPIAKLWLGFASALLLLGAILIFSQVLGGGDDTAELKQILRQQGEPLEDCLARVRQENPSYGDPLVQRLCQGR